MTSLSPGTTSKMHSTLEPCAKRNKVGKLWSEALWHKFWIILTLFFVCLLLRFYNLGCITENETILADIHSCRLFDFWVQNLIMHVCVFCTVDLFVCVLCTMDLFVLYHGYVCVFCNIDMFVCSALWICLFVCSVLRICLCVLYYGYVCVLKGTWAKEAPLALLIQMDRKWTQHLFVFSLLSRPVC